MARYITHIREPKKLLLAWQAPDEKKNRTRFTVGEITRDETGYTLRYHRRTPDVIKAMELSYLGYPAFDIRQEVHTRDVLTAFLRRLPPRSRSDFPEYLRGLRIGPELQISDFALLAYSEAKLPSDGFSLVDTLEDAEIPTEHLMDIAGYRHYPPALGADAIGKPVELVPEPSNPHDPGAIQILLGDRLIGYINRLQAPAVMRWLSVGQVRASVEKLNGRADWPRAHIFLEATDKQA